MKPFYRKGFTEEGKLGHVINKLHEKIRVSEAWPANYLMQVAVH